MFGKFIKKLSSNNIMFILSTILAFDYAILSILNIYDNKIAISFIDMIICNVYALLSEIVYIQGGDNNV